MCLTPLQTSVCVCYSFTNLCLCLCVLLLCAARLVCDAQDRLGYDVEHLKSHPFLRGTDWEHIRDRPAAIPIVVKHMADTSNFDDFEELDEQRRSESLLEVLFALCYTHTHAHTSSEWGKQEAINHR